MTSRNVVGQQWHNEINQSNCFSASCRKFGSLQGEGGNWKWGLCNANFEYFMVKKGYFENMYNLLFDQKWSILCILFSSVNPVSGKILVFKSWFKYMEVLNLGIQKDVQEKRNLELIFSLGVAGYQACKSHNHMKNS